MGTKTVYAGDEGLTYSPTTLTDGVTAVTITYVDGGITATTTTPVTVTHTLVSIAVTSQPTKTSYEYGDTFATAGMVVTATYSDNATAEVTSSCTISPANGATLTTVGTQIINISYSDASVSTAVTTTTSVTVARKSVPKPTWKSSATPTYSGSSINVASSTFWNNWNTTYFSYTGCSATNAGSHTATFTPNSNYRWSDSTTTSTDVTWTINKKAPTFSVSPTTIAISASNYSSGVSATITYDGDGTLSASSSNTSVASVTGSGTKNLTIKGNGSTAGSATITISATEGTNYSKPSNITISVTATYWEFGTDGGTADAAWFAGLKSYLASSAPQSSWVGKTKSVTLSSSVLGTTTHLVRVIGINADGSNTVTFQTKNCLSTTTAFGSNNAKWSDSGCTARTQCTNYYNAFPGKASIKQVTKVTNLNNDSSSSNMGTTNDYVWLPSYDEMGLGSYSYAPGGDEYTQGYSTAYSYYSSNTARVKNQSDSSSTAAWYWLRSRSTDYANGVGRVDYGGSAYDYNYYYTNGRLAPAFVIGN